MKRLRAIDVCAGAGGWACAARGLPIAIVAAFDREADALATYKLNHPAVETIACDVTEFDFSPWQGVDLILGGIPCEQLSVARNNCPASRREMASIKRLVRVFTRLPIDLQARWFCFEDVVQLAPLLPARTPRFTISSASYSAQARTRLMVSNIPAPTPGADQTVMGDYLRPGPHRISPRIFGKRQPSISGKHSTTFQPFDPAQKSKTIVDFSSRHDAEFGLPHPLGWRNIDWQEAALLQGFPVDYLFVANPGRCCKMIAQAIQVDTGRAILWSLLQTIAANAP